MRSTGCLLLPINLSLLTCCICDMSTKKTGTGMCLIVFDSFAERGWPAIIGIIQEPCNMVAEGRVGRFMDHIDNCGWRILSIVSLFPT